MTKQSKSKFGKKKSIYEKTANLLNQECVGMV